MKTSEARLDPGKLAALVVALVLGVAFWDAKALLPLKLLVVMMHESGHAVATWIAGGTVTRLTLAADQSGACLSQLPVSLWRQILVYSSGYLGSAVAGGALLMATFRYRLHRVILGAAAAWLAVFAVLLGGDLFTVGFCLGMAGVLALAARFLSSWAVDLVNLVLAAFSALYAVVDLRDDLWRHPAGGMSDASLLAAITRVPAVVWGALWTLFALAILGLATWSALRVRRPPPLALPRR